MTKPAPRTVQVMTLEEFKHAIRNQGHERIEDSQFRCPRCGTIQSPQDLINAGAGATLDDVDRYVAFSCVGRWDESKGCDWTLGGLFQIHELEVETPDGKRHPRFMPLGADQTQQSIGSNA